MVYVKKKEKINERKCIGKLFENQRYLCVSRFAKVVYELIWFESCRAFSLADDRTVNVFFSK